MSLVTAIAVAVLLAIIGFPFKYYICWFSWTPKATCFLMAFYFLIAGVVAGVLGWAAGVVSAARPTPYIAINGIIFGIGAGLALRADFKSRNFATKAPEELRQASSVLGQVIKWIEQGLADLTIRASERWIRNKLRNPMDLKREALRVQQSIASAIKERTTTAKPTQVKLLTEAIKQINDPATSEEGSERVIAYCCSWYSSGHLAKNPELPN